MVIWPPQWPISWNSRSAFDVIVELNYTKSRYGTTLRVRGAWVRAVTLSANFPVGLLLQALAVVGS